MIDHLAVETIFYKIVFFAKNRYVRKKLYTHIIEKQMRTCLHSFSQIELHSILSNNSRIQYKLLITTILTITFNLHKYIKSHLTYLSRLSHF